MAVEKKMSCTWLTVKEVAEYLHCDSTTIHKYIKQGKLKAVMPVGVRLKRVCLADLNKFLGVADEDKL